MECRSSCCRQGLPLIPLMLGMLLLICWPGMTGVKGLLSLDMPFWLTTQCSGTIKRSKLTVVDAWTSASSVDWLVHCFNLYRIDKE